MNEMPTLRTALLDLLYELRDTDIPLIIGGGYGIYLRTEHILKRRERTLLNAWPEARSTNDLDLFLRTELLVGAGRLKPLADALTKLGYDAAKGAEKYQFYKPGPDGGEAGSVKIDLLTGPKKSFAGTELKVDRRRLRPNPSVGVHAHPVDEALALEEKLLRIPFADVLSNGDPWAGEVFLPHPFSFLLMKLFSFRDQAHSAEKQLGRHHALDLYSVLALTNEVECRECLDFSNRLKAESTVIEAGRIAAEYFNNSEQLGLLRLREHAYYRPEFQLQEFMSAFAELFPKR